MKLAILASLISSAAAFAPAKSASSATKLDATKADLEKLAGECNPVVKFFDPLNLAEADFYGMGNEATIGWLRQCEIKHGRVAMAAFVGYCVQSNFVFPWPETLAGASHPATDLTPEAQWDAIPTGAKWQIFVLISALEVWDECGGGELPHYTKGRKPGQYPSFQGFRDEVHFVLDLYDPLGFSKKRSAEAKEKGLIAEINNGRLAMLGIFGFLAANKIDGSVPLLPGLGASPGYDGDPMVPFSADFSYFS